MNASPYKLEEYKFAKEKIRKNEARRLQIIILAITAFGVIIGLSDKVDEYLVPLYLLLILIICVNSYRSQSERQEYTAAYIIYEFERQIPELNYESGLVDFDHDKKTSGVSSRFVRFSNNWFNPFPLLLLATILCLVYFGHKYLNSNNPKLEWIKVSLYLLANILGYIFVVFTNLMIKKKNVSYYLRCFKKAKSV